MIFLNSIKNKNKLTIDDDVSPLHTHDSVNRTLIFASLSRRTRSRSDPLCNRLSRCIFYFKIDYKLCLCIETEMATRCLNDVQTCIMLIPAAVHRWHGTYNYHVCTRNQTTQVQISLRFRTRYNIFCVCIYVYIYIVYITMHSVYVYMYEQYCRMYETLVGNGELWHGRLGRKMYLKTQSRSTYTNRHGGRPLSQHFQLVSEDHRLRYEWSIGIIRQPAERHYVLEVFKHPIFPPVSSGLKDMKIILKTR